jgi:hypothetical protein
VRQGVRRPRKPNTVEHWNIDDRAVVRQLVYSNKWPTECQLPETPWPPRLAGHAPTTRKTPAIVATGLPRSGRPMLGELDFRRVRKKLAKEEFGKMRRWLLACLALLGGMLLNVALDLRSVATAGPGNEQAQKSAAKAVRRAGHPG